MAKKKILVVDDETSITRLMKFVIEKTGLYDVECENSGANAVSKMCQFQPDLVILDLNLPDLSGGEISAAMKQDSSLNRTPIIFLTGNVSGDEAESGIKIGGFPALAKPINMEMLLACIQSNLK